MVFEQRAGSAALLAHRRMTGILGDGSVEVVVMSGLTAGAWRARRSTVSLVEKKSTGRRTSVGPSVKRFLKGPRRRARQAKTKGV